MPLVTREVYASCHERGVCLLSRERGVCLLSRGGCIVCLPDLKSLFSSVKGVRLKTRVQWKRTSLRLFLI